MDINDVVIHVDETLDAQAQHDLEDMLREIDGVIAPRFNEHRTHLMIVAYNPELTSSMALLGEIRDQGYHAQHCGA
jgi:hypothetical protein